MVLSPPGRGSSAINPSPGPQVLGPLGFVGIQDIGFQAEPPVEPGWSWTKT
jgi:hypothetical protein